MYSLRVRKPVDCPLGIRYYKSIFTPDPQVTSKLDLLKEDRAIPIRLIVYIVEVLV